MDYKTLSKVADSAAKAPKGKNEKIQDALERRKKREIARKKIQDALERRKRLNERVRDSKDYKKFKVTDGYKSLLKKIKDELLETETTEDAVTACLNALEGQPAEQVLAATVEVLAEAIDALEAQHIEEIEETEE